MPLPEVEATTGLVGVTEAAESVVGGQLVVFELLC